MQPRVNFANISVRYHYASAITCTAAGKPLSIDHYFLTYKDDVSKSILSPSLRNFVLKISHAYSLRSTVGNISCLVFNIHCLPGRLSCTIGADSVSFCPFESVHTEYSLLETDLDLRTSYIQENSLFFIL